MNRLTSYNAANEYEADLFVNGVAMQGDETPMLNSSEFVYTVYQDNRQKSKPGFTVGRSGPLLIAKHKATGKKCDAPR